MWKLYYTKILSSSYICSYDISTHCLQFSLSYPIVVVDDNDLILDFVAFVDGKGLFDEIIVMIDEVRVLVGADDEVDVAVTDVAVTDVAVTYGAAAAVPTFALIGTEDTLADAVDLFLSTFFPCVCDDKGCSA